MGSYSSQTGNVHFYFPGYFKSYQKAWIVGFLCLPEMNERVKITQMGNSSRTFLSGEDCSFIKKP